MASGEQSELVSPAHFLPSLTAVPWDTLPLLCALPLPTPTAWLRPQNANLTSGMDCSFVSDANKFASDAESLNFPSIIQL